MTLERISTPIGDPTDAKEAVADARIQFRKKKGETPLEVDERRMRIIEAMDRAQDSARNKRVKKIYKDAKREFETKNLGG